MNIHKYIKNKGFKKVKTMLPYTYYDIDYMAQYGIVDIDTVINGIDEYRPHDISIHRSLHSNYSTSYAGLSKDNKIKLLKELTCYKLDLKYIELYVIVHKTWYLVFTNKESGYFKGYAKLNNTFSYNMLEEHMPDEITKRSFIIENLLK